MLEDRQHNALAALDIFQNVIRADSLSGDVARWQRAFDEAKRVNDPRKPPATPTPQQRADAAPDAASLLARVAAALAAGELSAVTAASLKRAIAAGSFAVADAGLKSVGF